MSQHRHLAAILFTDIVGYTSLMQEDENKAVALIKHYNEALNRFVSEHEGKVLNYYGDGSLCSFPSATEALRCAVELQKDLQTKTVVPLRIGLHIGEVFFEEGKALGDGVNVASRIQSIGQANTILFSREIHDKIKNHPEFESLSLGLFEFKNVEDPVEVFALTNQGLSIPKREEISGKLKYDSANRNKSARKKRVLAFLLLFILVVVGFLYIKFTTQKSTTDRSIAIIPFINLSNDPKQDYFPIGMMDEILNHLYKIGGLNVVSRTSSMAYKDTKKSAREIASELGVANILEGSVDKEGDSIRIIVQLINGKTDEHLWAETYIREFKDVFGIQSDIAQQVAAALKVKISAEAKSRIEFVPTENANAYNLYLQAKSLALNDDRNWKALLEKIILLDPSFAPAYADLGFYWLVRGIIGGDLDAKQVLDSAVPYLRKSLQLDSNLAAAHNYMAQLHLWYEWDFKAAKQEWEKFFQLNPSGAIWEDNYLDFLNADGRSQEAFDFAWKKGILDKRDLEYGIQMALSCIYLDQIDKGLRICDSLVLTFKKGDGKDLYWEKAVLFSYAGNYKQVINNLDSLLEIDPAARNSTRGLTHLAIACFHLGRFDEAEQIISKLKTASEKSSVSSPSYYLAMIYSATGRPTPALQWLNKAFINHEIEMYWLNVEPLFNPLRNNPGFNEILHKMKFK